MVELPSDNINLVLTSHPYYNVVEGCGHKRWFVNEFMCGDANLGIIIKDRLVELK